MQLSQLQEALEASQAGLDRGEKMGVDSVGSFEDESAKWAAHAAQLEATISDLQVRNCVCVAFHCSHALVA